MCRARAVTAGGAHRDHPLRDRLEDVRWWWWDGPRGRARRGLHRRPVADRRQPQRRHDRRLRPRAVTARRGVEPPSRERDPGRQLGCHRRDRRRRTHSQGESEDHFESSSREFSNPNRCHGVTYSWSTRSTRPRRSGSRSPRSTARWPTRSAGSRSTRSIEPSSARPRRCRTWSCRPIQSARAGIQPRKRRSLENQLLEKQIVLLEKSHEYRCCPEGEAEPAPTP